MIFLSYFVKVKWIPHCDGVVFWFGRKSQRERPKSKPQGEKHTKQVDCRLNQKQTIPSSSTSITAWSNLMVVCTPHHIKHEQLQSLLICTDKTYYFKYSSSFSLTYYFWFLSMTLVLECQPYISISFLSHQKHYIGPPNTQFHYFTFHF